MIFLFNAQISDFNLFKQYIESISDYPWKKAIIFYENNTSKDIDKFVEDKFDHTDLILRSEINKNQRDWAQTYELLNDELIWLSCRYDHIFVDSDFTHLNEVTEYIRASGCEKLVSLYLSNWPYALKKCVLIDAGPGGDSAPCFAWMTNKECDSLQIITKELYKEWWMNGDLSNETIDKPEDLPSIKKFRPWKVQAPCRELCRPAQELSEENTFVGEKINKKKLLNRYFSRMALGEICLANPRFDKGLFGRVMKYYGFNRKE